MAATAVIVSALLVVRAGVATPGGTRLVLLVGAAAVGLQVLGVTRVPGAAAPAAVLLGLLAGGALLAEANRGLAVELSVLYLASCELSAWAARLRSVIPETPSSARYQLGLLGAVLAGGGLVTAAVLAAGRTLDGPHGRGALALGLAAALVPLVLVIAALVAGGWRGPAHWARGRRP